RPLTPSARKRELFARLGLTEEIHAILLVERSANEARDRLSRNLDNLIPQAAADPRTSAPYKWSELSETAKHRCILAIVSSASECTQAFYLIGKYTTNTEEENWFLQY
ncbi:hypothetical protein BU23DRAFT_386583, partial [Bimuria novae-zelandiae CBS 107.79]